MRIRELCLLISLGTSIACAAAGSAQSPATNLPDAPKPQTHAIEPAEHPSQSYIYHYGILCGAGASTSNMSTVPVANCGAGMTIVPWPLWIEFGAMGPLANHRSASGFVSVDQDIPLARETARLLPMAMVGYSRLFQTGNALDCGLALGLPRFGKRKATSNSLRIELKDYWTFTSPPQHNVMLRAGWMFTEAD